MSKMEKFNELLLSTQRPGMELLIKYLEENGFYTAPCSTQYHLCKVGGLLEHSLNVYEYIHNFYQATWVDIPEESLIITALLHDIGKIGMYGKPNYIPNYLKNGNLSDVKPYATNKALSYIPHEVRSVMIAGTFIQLKEDEAQSILWHNGLYGPFKYDIQGKETPLYMLLHMADLWCSRTIEVEKGSE